MGVSGTGFVFTNRGRPQLYHHQSPREHPVLYQGILKSYNGIVIDRRWRNYIIVPEGEEVIGLEVLIYRDGVQYRARDMEFTCYPEGGKPAGGNF
jgi:hypothetical protein